MQYLKVSNLCLERGSRTLLSAFSLRLVPGQIVHLIGPNGSGKTTLLRALAGLTWANDGQIDWQVPFSYVGHRNGLARGRRVDEVLVDKVGKYHPLLKALGLEALMSSTIQTLSKGQKRKVALARTAMEDKPVWLLDEPMEALDVDARAVLLEMLKQQRVRGSIILTSHEPIDLPAEKVLLEHFL